MKTKEEVENIIAAILMILAPLICNDHNLDLLLSKF
jgi:hypothetical protein